MAGKEQITSKRASSGEYCTTSGCACAHPREPQRVALVLVLLNYILKARGKASGQGRFRWRQSDVTSGQKAPLAQAQKILPDRASSGSVTWLTWLPVTWLPVAPPHSTPTNATWAVPIYYWTWTAVGYGWGSYGC